MKIYAVTEAFMGIQHLIAAFKRLKQLVQADEFLLPESNPSKKQQKPPEAKRVIAESNKNAKKADPTYENFTQAIATYQQKRNYENRTALDGAFRKYLVEGRAEIRRILQEKLRLPHYQDVLMFMNWLDGDPLSALRINVTSFNRILESIHKTLLDMHKDHPGAKTYRPALKVIANLRTASDAYVETTVGMKPADFAKLVEKQGPRAEEKDETPHLNLIL